MGFFLSSVLGGRDSGRLRIPDVGRGTNGYDAPSHLFPNVSGDNGSTYIYLVAHRHHMGRGELVDDTRPRGLVDCKTAFASVVHYPALRWSEFIQNPTETDMIVPTPCIYCKRKAGITVEVPLIQAESKCGGRRHKSIETEGTTRRTAPIDVEVEPTPLAWIPGPAWPLYDQLEQGAPPPPGIAFSFS